MILWVVALSVAWYRVRDGAKGLKHGDAGAGDELHGDEMETSSERTTRRTARCGWYTNTDNQLTVVGPPECHKSESDAAIQGHTQIRKIIIHQRDGHAVYRSAAFIVGGLDVGDGSAMKMWLGLFDLLLA